MRTRALRRAAGVVEPAAVQPRDARMAGTSVAASATTIASPMTCTAEINEIGGAPAVPMRAAPGLVISGAASQPATRPTTAAKSASTRFSARKVAATTLGVPPTAFSSPTRRAYSDSRRPTRTVTLASASSARRNAPGCSECARRLCRWPCWTLCNTVCRATPRHFGSPSEGQPAVGGVGLDAVAQLLVDADLPGRGGDVPLPEAVPLKQVTSDARRAGHSGAYTSPLACATETGAPRR
jgi:hypothetical protein